MDMFLKRLKLFSTVALVMTIMGCGGGGGGGDNKGWIEITEPSSRDYFEVEDGNLDLVLGGWAFVSNRTLSDNSNCDNYIDLILSDCEDYVASDVWVEIINESNDTRTNIPARSGCEQEGCSSRWSWTITLSPGINSILVVAKDSKGNRGTDRISINVVPPNVPVGVSVEAVNGSVIVSWDEVLGATSYNIYYASSPGVTKTNYSTLPNGNKISGATSPQTITGLTTGIDYYFVVTSASSSGESTESLELNARIGPALSFDIKTFRFTWKDEPNATHYRLLENPDGVSGFSQVGSDIPQGTETYDHIVPLYNRINASYILQSCIGVDCTDFGLFHIIDNLVDAIGFFKANNSASGVFFGYSVSLSGDGNILAVGALFENNAAGAVYVFSRSGSDWSEQAYVKASNTARGDQFGKSVSLSGDGNTLAVGATGAAGAVYVFSRSGSDWSEQAYVKASNADSEDFFGASVSLSDDGNTLAVGAWNEDSSTSGINTISDELAYRAGAAYVFSRSGSDWSEQAYVKASNTGVNDQFGWSVSLSGDGNTLAVGAIYEDSSTSGINTISDELASRAGAAYVFSRSGSDWSHQAYVKASNTGVNDEFGDSVSLSDDGNTLAVGAWNEDSVYLY